MTDLAPDTLDRRLLKKSRVAPKVSAEITRVKLGGVTAFMTLMSTLIVGMILCAFAYPVVASSYAPQPVPGVWFSLPVVLILVVAIVLTLRVTARQRLGLLDLVLDDLTRTVTLPQNLGRDEPVVVPYDQITELVPADVVEADSSFLDADRFGPKAYLPREVRIDGDAAHGSHRGEMEAAVLIRWSTGDDETHSMPLVHWSGLPRANAFAHWLNRRLQIGDAPG